ncbi:MAG: YqaA family protein [Pseudomonadota bacterium]
MLLTTGGYLGLFVAAFLAATILPAQSELGLAALDASGDFWLAGLVLVASIGNTLGALVNWFIGRGIESFRDRRWFPATDKQLTRASAWYEKYGRWSLLISWMPIVGDPITLVAGIFREPLWRFLLIVGFAKTARYAVLAVLIA